MTEVLSGKAAEYRREAVEHAESLRSVFVELSGLSAREAAEELNRRGITTAWGYKWRASQVRLVRGRLGGALIATGDIQQTMRRAADAPVRTTHHAAGFGGVWRAVQFMLCRTLFPR
jgi:Recombinase